MGIFKSAVSAVSILLSMSQLRYLIITGLVLVVCMGSSSFADPADPPKATFEWEGRSCGENAEDSGWPITRVVNWIEVNWQVNVETELEYEIANMRFYSIKSVSFEIPFQYLTFSTDFPLTSSIAENFLCVLGPADFDLDFNLPEAMGFNCSCVHEVFDIPNTGDYYFIIHLKHPQEHLITTPKGMMLKLAGGNGAGVYGGFLLAHFSYLDDGYGAWVEGSEFVPPAGYYQNLFSESPDDRIGVSLKETNSLYKTARFLDEEDENRFVFGAIADGRSRVVVELHGVQSSANVTIPDGDGTWVSLPTLVNGVWRRTWQAPESYGGSADDNIQRRRPVGFAIVIDDQSIETSPFNLYKAPVVLLHGLWSDASIWDPLQYALRANGFRDYAESYSNQSSFLDNEPVISNHVKRALTQVRRLGLVAKKADIVGHSMGGCLAKEYGSSDYIRRIVTVGTPHYGSPIANVAASLGHDFNTWLASLSNNSVEVEIGALIDLQEGRCFIDGNRLNTPVLAINGVATNIDQYPADFGMWAVILNTLIGESPSFWHNELFHGYTSDWVVSGNSQKGGLTGQNVQDVNGVWHCEEPSNSEVISKTIDFLDAPSDEVSAAFNTPTELAIEPKSSIFQPTARPMVSMVSGAEAITITTPTAGTVFSHGDTAHVAVSTPPTATQVLVALSDGSVVVDDTAPFEMDIPIPQQSLGAMTIGALAWDTNGIIGTATTTVSVTTTATVTMLKVWPDSVLYLNTGETVPFVVHGIFTDDVERDVTTSQCGTTYNTTDSSVASIDTAGLLTAKAPGYCAVIVSNGDSMQIPVLVQPSLIGDINEDGEVNYEDLQAIANQWLQPPGIPSADIAPLPSGDGTVNFLDFAIFADHWLAGVE